MKDAGLSLIASFIYEYCGIDFMQNLSNLNGKIAGRLKELGLTHWEYYGYLRVEKDEWDKLIELITIHETYFYREENTLEEFKNVILPEFKDRTISNPLRIWCAACSTGEEPYTLAMLCDESGIFQEGEVEILASDIEKIVLSKASLGLYHKKSFSFRSIPKRLLDNYFEPYEDSYKVINSIQNMVEFKHLNLLNGNLIEKIGKVDIIFCRNVLIYFDKQAIKNLANSFYELLNPCGYLFLGHSETINGLNTKFKTIYKESVFYYRHGDKHL